jgi:hypothetical protein
MITYTHAPKTVNNRYEHDGLIESQSMGILTVKVIPSPTLDEKSIVPPCASTALLQNARAKLLSIE